MEYVVTFLVIAAFVVASYYGFTFIAVFIRLPQMAYQQIRRRGYSPIKASALVLGVSVTAVLVPIVIALLVPNAQGVWGIMEMAFIWVGLPIACSAFGCTLLVRMLPKREFRVSGRRQARIPFVFLGYAVILSGIAGLIAVVVFATPDRRTVGNVIGLLVAGLAFALMGRALITTGRRMDQQQPIEEAARFDARAPVLFLRPFVADGIPFVRGLSSVYEQYASETQKLLTPLKRMSDAGGNRREEDPIISIVFEVYLSRSFRERIGPFVALGNPEDYLPPEGATRTYSDDEGWYEYFERLARQAACIVMPVSNSDNLQRELKFLRSEGFQQRVFMFTPLWMPTDERSVFPARASLWLVSRLYGIPDQTPQLSSWSHLGENLQKLGFEFGADPGRGAVVTFDSEGKAIVLATGAGSPAELVEPVREHLIRTSGYVFDQVAD